MEVIGTTEALKLLVGWEAGENGKSIQKQFQFESFVDAWSFMSACALKAEKMNHHPDWSNAWNKVDVSLTTHDKGDVTTKDVELAVFMDVRAKTIHFQSEED